MSIAAHILAALIRFYQLAVSPLTRRHCRFHPTCSAYGLGAVRRFGAAQGGWLTVRRILRCHPFNPGGFDPVPDEFHWFQPTLCAKTEPHDTAP